MEAPSPNNIHNIVKAQIVFLLSTLTEENFEGNQMEIRSLSERHGIETYLHFIRRLITQTSSRNPTTSSPAPYDSSSNSPALALRLLAQEVQRLSRDPYLADRFRDAIDKSDAELFRNFDLLRFADRVQIRPLERLILASSIVAVPTRRELSVQAATMIHVEFDPAVMTLVQQHPCFEHTDLSINQMGRLMANLLACVPAGSPVLDATQRQALIAAAQAKYGTDAVSPVLQSVLPTMNLPTDSSLVQALVQLGAEITNNREVIRAILARFGISEAAPPVDEQIIEVVSALARLASEGAVLCDVGTLVKVLSDLNVNLDWASVITSFDRPDRQGVDTATLKLLIAILHNCPRDAETHAVTGFWTTWSNSLYQLRLLDALLSLPGDTFNFVVLPGHRIVTVDDVAGASPTIKSLAANVQGHTWNSLELFEVLVRAADSESVEVRSFVRDMLDKAVKISAELVHMGLLQVPNLPWNEIRLEYTQRLLAMFLGGHPNHQLVFMRIWQIEPTYLTNAFRDFYQESPLNITRILDVAQDLKILESLLQVRPFTFALDVAALASRREYLNLDKWLADNVSEHGADFLHSVIAFLDLKMESEKTTRISDPAVEQSTMPLNPQTITIFLRVLRNSSGMMHESDVDYCLEVRNACLQIHPRLMNLVPGAEAEPGFQVVSYSAEIESEVDSIYKQMYDEHISIDDVIQLLQRNKVSSNPRDHEIFSCMLHFLFDEYKFFQTYYPPRELAMTGYLFGSLIQYQLVDYIPLGIAIRYVLDALNCPAETNLFKFGIQALSRFESRLAEWQPLCHALLKVPHLLESRPDLAASINRAIASAGSGAGTPDLRNLTGPASEPPPVFTAIQPDRVDGEAERPPEEISDKILFIVNNLAPSNFDSKLTEMREQFEERYSRWFANYLVDQRVSTEPNNHQLYVRFLDALGARTLYKFVLHETLVKSCYLLNSEKTMQLGSERTLLKNVGSWLGTITLARDQPIKHNYLSFKDLLLEGYDNNRLVVAIAFVCKALEPCSRSTIFQPPNPWLMAVISLLAELYHFADLKLNPKFEIEILCKALHLDLDKVQATSILRNRPIADTLVGPPLPDYVTDVDSIPIGGYDPSQLQGEAQVMPIGGGNGPPDTQRAVGAHVEGILATILPQVVVSAQLAPLSNNPTFKRAVTMGVDRAIREIIIPVVERSVTIAGISTREIVSKDYATEVNEERMRKAGHAMAQKLAGSLALVTCKEPMKVNLGTHMRTVFTEFGFTEQMVPDNYINLLGQENLEIACQAIEKAARDRAVLDFDENFGNHSEVRRMHREQRPGQPFWDPLVQHTHFTQALPDPLRLKPSGVQPVQAAVYEDFGEPHLGSPGRHIRSNVMPPASEHKRRMTSRPGSTVSYPRNDSIPPLYPQQQPQPQQQQQLNDQGITIPHFFGHQEAMDRFALLVKDLEAVLQQLPPLQSLNALPPNHDLRHVLRSVMYLATDSTERHRTPLLISQKIVQLLYKATTPVGREMYLLILDQLCHTFDDVAKEAITWLVYAEDDRKLNIPVTVILLRSGLVNIVQQDQQLAKSLYTDARPVLLNFAAGLIRECLSSDPPIASQSQFQYTLEVLTQLAQSGKANDEVHRLLDDLRGVRRPAPPPATETAVTRQGSAKPETEQLREKLYIWFQQWVNIFQRSHSPEKSFVPFINSLTKQGILKAEDVSSFFFRVCAESSVNSYTKSVGAGDQTYAFHALDAMSRLIVYIIKYHGDASGVNNDQAKVHYLTKILTILVLVLANMHEEQGAEFQQKPFFRFFSSLLSDLHAIETSLGPAYFQLLLAVGDTFSSLQPTYFPGFAFSWMSLISHRLFMPKLLLSENREGWSAFHRLLLSLFKFMSPFLQSADLQPASRDLYRGSLRLLLVLLHDFPEFLSEYYFSLCDAIPQRCIQLRNVILSAFPPSVNLPDPHLESVPELGPIPPILSEFSSILKPGDLKAYLDQYLLNRGSPSFLPSLKDHLHIPAVSPDSPPIAYNLSLINCLVMYIGVSSVAQAKARSGSSLFVASDPGVVALQYLAANLDVEGQHHLLSAMVLHLRYPNAHTHWFSSLMLHLFSEVPTGRFREIMTKVLLERFLVHRPHPWGAMITFIELLRNPKYEFGNQEFIRIAPEVTLLLESVLKSMTPA